MSHMLERTQVLSEVIHFSTLQQIKILVMRAASSPSPKPSNPSHSLGDMHEIDYRNHQAFQA